MQTENEILGIKAGESELLIPAHSFDAIGTHEGWEYAAGSYVIFPEQWRTDSVEEGAYAIALPNDHIAQYDYCLVKTYESELPSLVQYIACINSNGEDWEVFINANPPEFVLLKPSEIEVIHRAVISELDQNILEAEIQTFHETGIGNQYPAKSTNPNWRPWQNQLQ